MTPAFDHHSTEIRQLCRQFNVQRLEVFGSAESAAFDPAHSDVDLIVDFGTGEQPDLFSRYFGLKESLEQLFGRSVELVMAGAMVNPHFIESANFSRRPLYARSLAEVA